MKICSTNKLKEAIKMDMNLGELEGTEKQIKFVKDKELCKWEE